MGVSRIIYKYEVREALGGFDLSMHRDSTFMHLDVVGNHPFMWWMVEPSNPLHVRRFYIMATDEIADFTVPDYYLGTFLLDEGGFVGHLFTTDPFERR